MKYGIKLKIYLGKNLIVNQCIKAKIHKSIKAKINLYNTSFYCNKKPIVSEHYTCFSAILSDSIVKVDNIIRKYS